ncbi:ribose-phosphate pyrophosphokinase [Candidatus Uhrbacteria bacterium]|nr:ribose-phosphate pyrophosphokinase [Candidatus Uhrbacteria bacterium]
MLTVIPTSSAEHLCDGLSKHERVRLVRSKMNKDGSRYFPDGEIYTNLPPTAPDEHIVVVHSGQPSPNDGLHELEILLGLLKKRTATSIDLFFTYFPYGMMDGVFEEGELNVAESLIEKYVNYYGVSRIFILDPHFGGREWVEKYPVASVSSIDGLKERVLAQYPDALFLAPDAGGQRRFGLSGFFKKRDNSFTVSLMNGDEMSGQIKGKTVVIVDDLVETGGTLARIAAACRDANAAKLIAIIGHAVLPQGVQRVREMYDEVYFTNSIALEGEHFDVSSVILERILPTF